jgi:hypothetical protein
LSLVTQKLTPFWIEDTFMGSAEITPNQVAPCGQAMLASNFQQPLVFAPARRLKDEGHIHHDVDITTMRPLKGAQVPARNLKTLGKSPSRFNKNLPRRFRPLQFVPTPVGWQK